MRWFVLADGISYGTGGEAPQRDAGRFRFSSRAELGAGFLRDFEALLELCAEAGVALLPVLLDFHFAYPGLDRDSVDARTLALWDRTLPAQRDPAERLRAARERAARLPVGYVKGGRADVLREPLVMRRFFDNVLAPLLVVSRRHAASIYAWELLNEPEWITRRSFLERGFRLPLGEVVRFLQLGSSLIREHGFAATVGFARARTLRALCAKLPALGLYQHHYYPQHAWARLTPAGSGASVPTLLGEFASRTELLRAWPELSAAEQGIEARLELARRRGYDAALIWSYRARDRASLPERAAIESAIASFVHGPQLRPDAVATT